MNEYPKDWFNYPCEYCDKLYSEHHGYISNGTSFCCGLKDRWRPHLPESMAVDCVCNQWAYADDYAAIWPTAGENGLLAGHHPCCEKYEPPPTVALTIEKYERRLKRLQSYLTSEKDN